MKWQRYCYCRCAKVSNRGLQKNERIFRRANQLVTGNNSLGRPGSVGERDLEDSRSGEGDGVGDGSVGGGDEDV